MSVARARGSPRATARVPSRTSTGARRSAPADWPRNKPLLLLLLLLDEAPPPRNGAISCACHSNQRPSQESCAPARRVSPLLEMPPPRSVDKMMMIMIPAVISTPWRAPSNYMETYKRI